MSAIGRVALQIAPIIIYHTLGYLLIMLGAYAVFTDHGVVHDACGKRYHFWKFGFLNTVMWVFSSVSYCVWKGGGEGARARALVLTIFYFAFFFWGILLWQHLSDACAEVMDKQYNALFMFHHACTGMNGVSAFMFLLHEIFLGKYVGADLTIMAEVHHRMNSAFLPERGGPVDMSAAASNNGHMPNSMQSPGPSHPPSNDLSPQLSYEYEKIMQNTSSSSTLPQTTP